MFVNQEFFPESVAEIKCCKCEGILWNPLVFINSNNPCLHSACQQCTNGGRCPNCNWAGRLDKRLASLINNQVLKCPKHRFGCKKQGKVKDGFPLNHERLCLYREILCDCKEKVQVKDLQPHMQICLGEETKVDPK
jgi:hypothetical protein